MKYIIEHMEPEMYPWCIIEYTHISEIVGKNNLLFTNVKRGSKKIQGLGKIYKESIHELTDTGIIKSSDVCLLDPSAPKTLLTQDNKKFKYLLFGGILGDYPRRRRTRKLSSITNHKRNLKDKQMSTDTAVLVAHMIIKGKKFNQIPFQDKISIEIDKCSSVELPFRYIIKNSKPVLPNGLVDYLKRRKNF